MAQGFFFCFLTDSTISFTVELWLILYNIYGEDIYSVTIQGTLITVNLDIDILPKLSNVDVVFER